MSQEVGSLAVWATPSRLGRYWFKWRSFSPLPLLVGVLFLKPDYEVGPVVGGVSIGVILLAECLRLWSVGFAGSATRTRGDTVPELVHAGPYRWVRNPLYIANILMYTFTGVVFGFGIFSVVIFLYSVLQYTLIIAFEEELLLRTFGTDYDKYRSQVRRWWSSGVPYPPSRHLFSLEQAFRSERSTLIAMLIMALLYFAKRQLF